MKYLFLVCILVLAIHLHAQDTLLLKSGEKIPFVGTPKFTDKNVIVKTNDIESTSKSFPLEAFEKFYGRDARKILKIYNMDPYLSRFYFFMNEKDSLVSSIDLFKFKSEGSILDNSRKKQKMLVEKLEQEGSSKSSSKDISHGYFSFGFSGGRTSSLNEAKKEQSPYSHNFEIIPQFNFQLFTSIGRLNSLNFGFNYEYTAFEAFTEFAYTTPNSAPIAEQRNTTERLNSNSVYAYFSFPASYKNLTFVPKIGLGTVFFSKASTDVKLDDGSSLMKIKYFENKNPAFSQKIGLGIFYEVEESFSVGGNIDFVQFNSEYMVETTIRNNTIRYNHRLNNQFLNTNIVLLFRF